MKHHTKVSSGRQDALERMGSVPGKMQTRIGAESGYRSLMKSVLFIGIIVPLVPVILTSGALYYQFHVSFDEEIRKHLSMDLQSARAIVDDLVGKSSDDADYGALHKASALIRGARAGHFGVVDKNGRYLAGTIDDTEIGESVAAELSRIDRVPPDQTILLRKADRSGDKNIYAIAKLRSRDLFLVYKESASEVFSGLNRTRGLALAVVMVVACLITVNAVRLSKMMVRRITQADREKQKLNEQMFQTDKLASIGELAAGVAHEINNPVAIMVEEAGWIDDLLGEDEFGESKNLLEFRRALAQIQTQGKRCREITHKLLSFARKTDPKRQDVQVLQLVQDTVAILEKRATSRGIGINSDVGGNLPAIRGSYSELQQVLVNLVNNAIDATEGRGEDISISAKLEGDVVAIKVSDSGSGISEEDFSKIFDPFFTTKPFGKGTGLGLAICYGIIKQLGGEIEVTSAKGKGSVFKVCIPYRKAEEDSGGAQAEEAPGTTNRLS